MTEEKPPGWQISQEDLIKLLNQQTESGHALVIAGIIEDELQKLLLSSMRELSSNLAERLFDGYGPLSTFAGKIDVAFALDLIDESVHRDLRVIKDIRNRFAHTTQFAFFNSPEISKLCEKLSNFRAKGDNGIVYRTRALECINTIKAAIDRKIFEHAMKDNGGRDDR